MKCLSRCSVPVKTVDVSHVAPAWAKHSEWTLFQPLGKPSLVARHSLKPPWEGGWRKFRKERGCQPPSPALGQSPAASLVCVCVLCGGQAALEADAEHAFPGPCSGLSVTLLPYPSQHCFSLGEPCLPSLWFQRLSSSSCPRLSFS